MVELLWLEINRAIIMSDDVKSVLLNLRDMNLLNDVKEYNLVLDVNKLIELLFEDAGRGAPSPLDNAKSARDNGLEEATGESRNLSEVKDEIVNREVSSTANVAPQNVQRIDGRPLTENQILFEEYSRWKFDENAWMRKIGIRL